MKKFMIFFAIIMLCIICLIVGGFLGVYITFNNGEQFCNKLVESSDKTVDKENDDIVAYDDEGNVIMIKDFDKYFLSLEYKLDDSYVFINSSNNSMISTYVGAMYSESISDEYKVVYTLNKMFYDNENLYELVYSSVDNKNDEDPFNTTFELSYETINTLIGKVFADSEIDKDFKTTEDMKFEQIEYVTCDNGICEVGVQTELGSYGFTSGYLTNLVSETYNEENGYTEYIVSTYYIESTSDEDLYKLYDKKDGNLVKPVKVNAPYILEYDTFKEYFKDVLEYKYLFNEEGLLVSVEAM